MRIPYSTEQGIILAEQGNLVREQGILSVRIQFNGEWDFPGPGLLGEFRFTPQNPAFIAARRSAAEDMRRLLVDVPSGGKQPIYPDRHAAESNDQETRDRKNPRPSLFFNERVACEVQHSRTHWITRSVC